MNSLWYLSMPVGTIFAFRLNELASLSHLRDPEVERRLALEDITEDKVFVGYIAEVSPSGLEVILLVSEPQTSYIPTSSSAHLSSLREGIAIHTNGPFPLSPSAFSSSPSSSSRPRRSTHPAYTAPPSSECHTSSRALVSSQTPLSALRPCGPSRPPELVPTAESTTLRPSAPLPWARAYAYRPDIRVRTPSALTKSTGRRHRFVVGGLTAGGTARAARTQARLSKAEVERAGKAMGRVREAEEEEYVKRSKAAHCAAAASKSDVPASEPPSPTSSGTNASSDSGGSSRFSDIPLSSVTEHSATGSKEINNNNNNISDGSDGSATTPRANAPTRRGGGNGGSGGGGLSAPIVIDVILEIADVHVLPKSPTAFEAAVARLEKLECASRHAPKERVREWARNAVAF